MKNGAGEARKGAMPSSQENCPLLDGTSSISHVTRSSPSTSATRLLSRRRVATCGAGFCAELELALRLQHTLAWKIPWAEEPGRLQSMGSLRVGHD